MVLDKKQIRKSMIKKRADMNEDSYQSFSNIIKNKIKDLKQYKEASMIGIYLSYNHEVDTWNLIKENEKRFCVPVIQKDHQMIFIEIDSFDQLQKNKYGIYEPINGKTVDKDDIDLMIVPMVAYNDQKERLGYGGGYYDRYLKNFKGIKVGIAFQLQKCDDFQNEDHDIILDMIITE